MGGPRDNTANPAYAAWLAECDVRLTALTIPVEVRLSEATSDYQNCLVERADEAAQRAQALPPDPLLPALHLAGAPSDHDGSCGAAPVPPLDARPVGGDLVWTVHVEAMHLGGGNPEGSITYSSWSYNSRNGANNNKAGPINTVFYGNGDVGDAKTAIRTDSHFKATNHHGFRCGGSKFAYIWDASHGGQDRWHESHWDTRQSEAHHSNAGAYHCDNSRIHLRHYGVNNLQDKHSPSWGYYSIANSHHEDHNHDNVDHQQGANHVGADMTAAGYSVSYWTSPNNGQQVALIRVP